MMMNLSKWLPARDFSRIKWLSFWRSVYNHANDNRRQEILEETKDLKWVYLGDGSMGYSPGNNWDQEGRNLIKKTIQGNYRKENKVQIWIGTGPDTTTKLQSGDRLLPQQYGFHKIIYDPANKKHTLSKHDINANVLWNLGFTDSVSLPPMAINYK
jgi:hypothetical protein